MSPEFLRRWHLAGALASTLAVAACSGGGGNAVPNGPPPPPPPPPGVRGDVVATTTLGTLSAATIDAQTAMPASLVNASAHCGVQVVRIQYHTIDPLGHDATAGAGLLVPDETACPGPHPLLSHQHGTSVDATFDTASTQPDSLAAEMSALYASHGYVVVMPNYLGYAGSSVNWHAYLQAGPSGEVVVDALRAARQWVKNHAASTQLSGDVYLSGTSQGGYVTLATQKVIQTEYAGEFQVREVAPTSGPYDVEATFVKFLQQPDSSTSPNTTPAAFVLYGFQRTYGDVWSDPHQVFNDPWAAEFANGAPVILPGPYAGETQLRTHCVLPWNVKDPGGPVIGSCSNAPLLQAGFVSDFLNGTTTYSPSGLAARAHSRANALVHVSGTQPWSPAVPVTACYGDLDPMATPNALVAAQNLANTTAVDVQSDPGVPTYIRAFMQAGASDPLYHGNVEGPGCTSYTRNVVFPILY